ncbi:MAG: pyrroline-5-carboxylate reductase [Alphaproteobacteria bacterium]|nr:pyrroline-5-carboxylate reductase [Rhodospirillales bacterium]MCW9046092.1 pyrroline-5-carboxylate reductase [Alphaproteobacteria bacterium]
MSGALLIVGCGKMGSALLDGWLNQGRDPNSIHIVEPTEELAVGLRSRQTNVYASFEELPDSLSPSVVLLAVKPQVMEAVVKPYKEYKGAGTVFLSIAAGKTIKFFENILGSDAGIVRTMPNTPAAVGRGITVAYANAPVNAEQKEECQTLLEAVGDVAWIGDEDLMDGVVAVSGSGPAYVFYLTEALAAAGVKAGLPEGLAQQLARATVSGAGELQYQSTEEISQLRINVTSPGGTTAAALEVLMGEDGLQPVMDRAILAAAQRSKDLA